MLEVYLVAITCLLLIALFAGLARQWFGPTRIDRILALQLFGSAGVAILVLLSVIMGQSALVNIALILVLLAPLTVIVLVKLRKHL